MSLKNQKGVASQKAQLGASPMFYFALLIVVVLSQNPDWDSNLLWWGSLAFLFTSFLFCYRGVLVIERSYTTWILTFFIFAAASIFWAVKPTLVEAALKSMIVNIVVFFLIHSAIKNERDVERVLGVVLLSIVINSLWLFVTNQSMFESPAGQLSVLDRLGENSLWNANSIGMMAAIAMLIALYFQKKTSRHIFSAFYIVIVIFMIFITLISGSRKALLTVAMGICGFLFASSKGKRIRTLLLIGIILGALYYLVMEVPFFHSIIGWRIEGFFAFFTGSGEVDSSTQIRDEYIVDALRAWGERPLVGCGLDCYREINTIVKGMYAHNNYAELLADLGIFGASIYYSAYVYCFVKLLKIRNKSNLVWLMFIVLLIFAVTDFGCVSYDTFLNQLLLLLMFSIITLNEKKTSKVRFSIA